MVDPICLRAARRDAQIAVLIVLFIPEKLELMYDKVKDAADQINHRTREKPFHSKYKYSKCVENACRACRRFAYFQSSEFREDSIY